MRNLDQAAINIVESTRGCDLFLVKVKSLVDVFRTAVREMKLSVGEDFDMHNNRKRLLKAVLSQLSIDTTESVRASFDIDLSGPELAKRYIDTTVTEYAKSIDTINNQINWVNGYIRLMLGAYWKDYVCFVKEADTTGDGRGVFCNYRGNMEHIDKLSAIMGVVKTSDFSKQEQRDKCESMLLAGTSKPTQSITAHTLEDIVELSLKHSKLVDRFYDDILDFSYTYGKFINDTLPEKPGKEELKIGVSDDLVLS